MKGIFLSNKFTDLERVYVPEHRKHLCEKADVSPTLYSREMVLADVSAFQNVEYIFSTWGMPVFTEEEIHMLFPKLKRLYYAAGTVQMFARPFLHCGVKIHSAWMANAVPVAEYTVAQILLANKGYFLASEQMSRGEPKVAKLTAKNYPGNFGAPVGIIGIGAIGKLVCEMLKPFRLRVLAYSRSLTEEKAKELGVEKSDIATIFKTCQVVSNHLANNEHTQGIFNRVHFNSMVPYGVFLNTGRGAQVVEADLAAVLGERPDLTAVLDVTKPEPPVENHPFYRLPNCILTPHIAGSSGDEVQRMAQWMEEEYDRVCASDSGIYEVSEEMLERMA